MANALHEPSTPFHDESVNLDQDDVATSHFAIRLAPNIILLESNTLVNEPPA